ncbi:MAG: BamA/TamA family outer membrane protein [Elusimicrobia bacterium]|nr:BamA/TamA family outer membrane protein [Elusimicrobiota bacterium]MDE2237787.1 BamA/TamA family outer membrane protein [Elusimicrobiota bacterium]MDE2426181.1 BamA/TamA family outer membrane protein [Elusimicrobiota bacterium]
MRKIARPLPRLAVWLLAAVSCAAAPSLAIAAEAGPAPWLRWMLRPTERGMLVRLPVVDTDPNRGVTVGVMPIWVLEDSSGTRIEQIHAPSLTFNKNFGVTPTYRYYLYPEKDAALLLRGSIGKYEREAMGSYDDASFLGTEHDLALRLQYAIDADPHFYGLGPDAPLNHETNYKRDYMLARGSWGLPLFPGSGWRAHFGDRLISERVGNGPLPGLRGFTDTFPALVSVRHQQCDELQAALDYDSRDDRVTTRRGAFLKVYRDQSLRGALSSFNFARSGLDGRYFHLWQTPRQMVTALSLQFEQVLGNAPFWLLPSLGGKYSLRAYGEGRYVDRSMIALNAEQRVTFYQARVAGVSTEFELDPFVGVGTVADNPGRYALAYARPVVGAALRAVARPQVVGSIDFGVGQEGLSVFMDINYSF